MSKDFLTKHIAIFAGISLLVTTVILFGFMAVFESLGLDAGYYLTSGRFIVQGLTPNVDFPNLYAPGAYYIFAIIEQLFDTDPFAYKLFVYLLHLLNGYILFSIIRKLGHEPKWAFVFAAFFVCWIFTLDGQKIELEPIQNFFLLLTFRVVMQREDSLGITTAGLLAGCALMIKQSSMFTILPLTLLVFIPALIKETSASANIDWPAFKRISIFLPCLGIPFTVYVALTGQNFFDSLSNLTTYGGNALAYSNQYNFAGFIETLLIGNRGQILLLPMSGVAVLLIMISTTRQNLFFVTFAAFTMLPIVLVRGYGHYVQLLAPWAVLVLLQFVFAVVNFAVESKKDLLRNLLTALLFLLLLPPYMYRAREILQNYPESPIAHQRQLADEVREALKDRSDTLVVGIPWLYYLADISPPNRDLSFTNVTKSLQPRLSSAKRVIVAPFVGFGKYVEEIEQLLLNSGFSQTHVLSWNGREVAIYERL